jgi:hypothetical protein
MPKRSSKKRSDDQQSVTGARQQAPLPADLTQDGKNPAAVALGRLGGAKGGKARAAALTPEQRREIAKKAAAARWRKK